jgi:hypothetical protein
MNLVYAIRIFAALLFVLLVMRLLVGKGLREVTTTSDWHAALKAIVGTLVVSCFSWRTPLFFVTLSLWAIYVPRLFGKAGSGRLPAYALLACICPEFTMELTDVGPVRDLMSLNAFRILQIFILLPEAMRLLTRRDRAAKPSWLQLCDVATFGYLVYWTLQLYGRMNGSSLAREAATVVLDSALPYYVLSRACVHHEMRRRVLSMILIGAAYECFVAMAEALSRHLLYGQLQYLYETRWNVIGALTRGPLLRAQAGLPGPLPMAVLALFAIGLWFAVRPAVRSAAYTMLGLALFGGLAATISRGPMLSLLVLVACIAGLRYFSDRKLLLFSLISAAVVSMCWQLGIGDYIVGLINLTSTDETASFNILYRQELLSQSLALIHQSPWFGVPNYMQSLENLRQGEGIIDLVNTYLVIALNVGILGVALFLVPYGLVLWKQTSAIHEESPAQRGERRAWNPLMLAILSVVFTVSPVSIVHPILIWTVALAIARLRETLPVARRFEPTLAHPA